MGYFTEAAGVNMPGEPMGDMDGGMPLEGTKGKLVNGKKTLRYYLPHTWK